MIINDKHKVKIDWGEEGYAEIQLASGSTLDLTYMAEWLMGIGLEYSSLYPLEIPETEGDVLEMALGSSEENPGKVTWVGHRELSLTEALTALSCGFQYCLDSRTPDGYRKKFFALFKAEAFERWIHKVSVGLDKSYEEAEDWLYKPRKRFNNKSFFEIIDFKVPLSEDIEFVYEAVRWVEDKCLKAQIKRMLGTQ